MEVRKRKLNHLAQFVMRAPLSLHGPGLESSLVPFFHFFVIFHLHFKYPSYPNACIIYHYTSGGLVVEVLACNPKGVGSSPSECEFPFFSTSSIQYYFQTIFQTNFHWAQILQPILIFTLPPFALVKKLYNITKT